MKYLFVGLTGNSGSGKTVASKYFESLGIPVINSDEVVREVERPGTVCLRELEQVFGCGIISENGELLRRKLGELCFGNKGNLEKLNSIVHPYVVSRILELSDFYRCNGNGICIVEAPQLFESGLDKYVDKIVLMISSKNAERLVVRDNISSEVVAARLKSQIPNDVLIQNADLVIYNDGSLEDLYIKLDGALNTINTWKEEKLDNETY